jgi:hypothetical protein
VRVLQGRLPKIAGLLEEAEDDSCATASRSRARAWSPEPAWKIGRISAPSRSC